MAWYRRTVFTLIMFCSSLVWGQDQKQLVASLKTGPIYPPGRWLAIQVECRNPTNRSISGQVVLPTGSLTSGGYEWVLPVNVPAQSRLRTEMLVKVLWQAKVARSGQKSEPLATLSWRSTEGAELARDFIQAVSDASSGLGEADSTGLPGVIVMYVSDRPVQNETDDPVDLTTLLTRNSRYKFTLKTDSVDRLSRRGLAWDAVRVVMIDQLALERMDPAQQRALLDHVASGASLVVIPEDSSIQASWIGPFLPMDLVGERESDVLESREFPPIRFTRTVRHFVGALRSQSTAVVSSSENTFGAYRPYGLGRIVMVVFPVSALSPNDSASFAIWSELLGISKSDLHDPERLLESISSSEIQPVSTGITLKDLLPRMVGAQAPSWKTAAIISLVYTGLVGVVIFFVGTRRRPLAIVFCAVGGILLAGVIVGLSMIRSTDQPVMMASIGVNDLADGASITRATTTFFGLVPSSGISMELSARSAVNPIFSAGRQSARIYMFPFEVNSIPASTGALGSVWEITSSESPSSAVGCELTWGSQGAFLSLKGLQSLHLESPRLLIGASVIPLGSIRAGDEAVPIGARNLPGDYSNATGMIVDDESKLRTEILMTVEARRDPIWGLMRRSLEPRLVGFDSKPDSDVKVSVPLQQISQTLVRVPVKIRACEVGQTVRVDPAFVQIRREAAVSLPYRTEADRWTEASQGGTWLVGLSSPQAMGLLKPERLRLDVDLRARGYRFVIQRGQIVQGKVLDRSTGEVVMEWDNTDTRQSRQIDLKPEDIDANGWIWLRITATPTGEESVWGTLGGGPATLPNWQILRFDATLWGTVVATPQPIKTTWPTEQR